MLIFLSRGFTPGFPVGPLRGPWYGHAWPGTLKGSDSKAQGETLGMPIQKGQLKGLDRIPDEPLARRRLFNMVFPVSESQ